MHYIRAILRTVRKLVVKSLSEYLYSPMPGAPIRLIPNQSTINQTTHPETFFETTSLGITMWLPDDLRRLLILHWISGTEEGRCDKLYRRGKNGRKVWPDARRTILVAFAELHLGPSNSSKFIIRCSSRDIEAAVARFSKSSGRLTIINRRY